MLLENQSLTDLYVVDSIAGSCKPAFMLDPYLQLFRVNMQDGSLKNTDGVYDIDALGPDGARKFLDKGKIFQGVSARSGRTEYSQSQIVYSLCLSTF